MNESSTVLVASDRGLLRDAIVAMLRLRLPTAWTAEGTGHSSASRVASELDARTMVVEALAPMPRSTIDRLRTMLGPDAGTKPTAYTSAVLVTDPSTSFMIFEHDRPPSWIAIIEHDCSFDEVARAVVTVGDCRDAGRFSTPTSLPGSTHHVHRCALTPRECAVLALIARGDAEHRIAEQLDITRHTVRTHLRNSMRKLGANTRVEAIRIAERRGWLEDVESCECI